MDDNKLLSCTANLLERPEPHIFWLAFQVWFGENPSKDIIDHAYSESIREGVVPFWVRDFCRKKLDQQNEEIEQIRRKKVRLRQMRRKRMVSFLKKILFVS